MFEERFSSVLLCWVFSGFVFIVFLLFFISGCKLNTVQTVGRIKSAAGSRRTNWR